MLVALVGLCDAVATVSPKPVTYTVKDKMYFLSGTDFSCEIGSSGKSCLEQV